MRQDWGETLVVFPGVVGSVVEGGDTPVEQRISNSEIHSVQSFLEEHCEFGKGLRISSSDLFYRYQVTNDDAMIKWFHTQMKGKGFIKKTVRMVSGTITKYDGFRFRQIAENDMLK